jgi:tRNA(fMet)-specific endonuclease VapC
MAGRFLLDTNIVIALLGREAAAEDGLAKAAAVYVPAVVLGELYYGARKSTRVAANVKQVDDFGAANVIVSCDASTARHYGEARDALRKRGRPIPDNDIWIAAVALQHGLVLATRDAHFVEVDGLSVEAW